MSDTIAAIATAQGAGGIAIVRLSGPEAERILMDVFRPARKGELTSHMLTYGHVYDGNTTVDECMAVLMRAPRSYTREDVAEIQLHGGGYIAQRVLELCLRHGAELAAPGEFTRRAFLNGRIDLSQAEAVMNLIAAQGAQSHRAAMRQLKGGASSFIRKAADELYAIQAGVAACIDYPEEISEEEAAERLAKLQHLKQNPREEEPNRLQLLRGERLYEELPAKRAAIDRALMEFERTLSTQDRTQIEQGRKALTKALDAIEFDL